MNAHPIREIVVLALLMAGCLLQSALLGHALGRRFLEPARADDAARNGWLDTFMAATLGLGLNITALFLLAATGAFTPTLVAAWAIGSAFLALILASPWSALQRLLAAWRREPALALECAALGLLGVVFVMQTLRPPGHWDDTQFHLPAARHLLETGGLAVQPFLRFPLFPLNMQLLEAVGLALDGVPGAAGMAMVPLYLLAVSLLGTSRWLFNNRWTGWVLLIALFLIHPVRDTFGYAYIDDGLALFCWAAVLAVAMGSQAGTDEARWVALAGVFAGLAVGTKLFGAPAMAVLGLTLLARRRWKLVALFAAMAVLFGAWWIVRAAWISGDPVHPAGGNLFGHYLWNADDLAGQTREQRTHGVGHSPWLIGLALTQAGAPIFLLSLVSLVWARRENVAVRTLQASFLGYLLFWFFVSQVERYLAPLFGVGCVLAALAAHRAWETWHPAVLDTWRERILRPRPRLRIMGPALLLVLFWAALGWKSYGQALDRMRHWDELQLRVTGFEIMDRATRLRDVQGRRVVQIGFENAIWFFGGTAIGDWFGPGRYTQFQRGDGTNRLISAAAMTERLTAFDARMLAINKERVEFDHADYARHFDTVLETSKGALLVRRDPTAPAPP